MGNTYPTNKPSPAISSPPNSPSHDLSLPTHCPKLGTYGNTNWDNASFALYTLIDLPYTELTRIATTLEKRWMQASECSVTHLIRIPQTHNFANKTLQDILSAQIAMDKELTPRSDAGTDGDLGWWPNAFIVVVCRELEKSGLLFVYADDDEEVGKEKGMFAMDKYFFKPKDAYMMLSSLVFGDEYLERSKELYEIGEDGLTGLEREGVDSGV